MNILEPFYIITQSGLLRMCLPISSMLKMTHVCQKRLFSVISFSRVWKNVATAVWVFLWSLSNGRILHCFHWTYIRPPPPSK